MILHYIRYCHPNLKKFVRIQDHVWLQTLHIYQNYTLIIFFMAWLVLKKTQGSQQKCSKKKVWGKKIAYMKHVKIQWCHMGVISTPKNMIRQRKECVHIHSQITRYHTGNIYYDVVPNVKALIFLTRKQMLSIPTPVLQFVFIIII